jgi:YVTN family beta-propeller protein
VSAAGPQPRIFISYRRDDSQGFARSIHDRLAQHFGPDAVFRDINDIEPGLPWEQAIDEALASCDVFVLLIGRHWLDATDDEGNRRIDNPEDRHRREIETAINRRIRIFVALMEDAHMPRKRQLPPVPPGEEPRGVQLVPALHALRIADFAFDYGVQELITNIERAAAQARVSEEAGHRETAESRPRQAQEQERVEEGERGLEQRAEERGRADDRDRTAEERTFVPERKVTADRERERRRRMLTLASVGVAVLAVIVVALLIVSSGEDGGGGAAVDGAPIPVGDLPVDLVYGNGGLWVTNRVGGSVSFVEEGDPPELDATRRLGGEPAGIAVAGGSVFIADGGGDSLWEIDSGGDLGEEIPVGLRPGTIAVDEEALWVANAGSNTVSRIDPHNIQSIPVGGEPFGVATGGEAVWVTNRADNTVSRIDPASRKVDETIPVGNNPKGIAVSDEAVWVANTDDDTVSRIDLASRTAGDAIPVGTEPRGVVSAFGSVWVTNGGSDSVSRIDSEGGTVIETIDVGAGPEGITAGPDSLWVANGGADTVTRIKP